MQIITDTQGKKNIGTIKLSGIKRDALIHVTGVWAISQVVNHGNTKPLNQLVSALSKSDRREAFVVWVRDHCQIVELKTKVLEYRKDRKIYGYEGEAITPQQALEKAEKTPFYDYTKESKPASSYDVLTRLANLVKTANNFQGEVKHKDLLNTLAIVIEATLAGDTIEVSESHLKLAA